MFVSRREFEKLKADVKKIQQEKRCLLGDHKWVMVESSYSATSPYIRCSECNATPKVKP